MSVCGKSQSTDTSKCRVPHVGYSSPIDAVKNGPRETIAYVTCVNATWKADHKPDFLATVDLDPKSPTYSQIIHKTEVPNAGDELHHMGWNACSSCRDCNATRSHLIVPGLNSDRIYIIDTKTDPKVPRLQKVIETSQVHGLVNSSAPHTVHCLPSGDVMISCMGDAEANAKGTFLLLEQGTFDLKGTWQLESDSSEFNYDYWYQPRHNVMVSTEWAAPKTFRKGFDMQDVKDGLYGHSISVWDWAAKKRLQRLDLGVDGQIPLEVRFLHDPKAIEGFVGCALSSSIVRFYKTEENSWATETVFKVPPKKVNWILPELPALITDILISLDDRYLYFSNWLHGDIRQYDISDTRHPKLVGQIFLGGSVCKNEKIQVTEDQELQEQPCRPTVKGVPVRGGPQMLQLSLDGKRLYVTNSLFSAWDEQFYPENIEQGSMMLRVDVNTEEGGLSLDETFLVDFGPGVLAHEMRFPGGDCTSDIWE